MLKTKFSKISVKNTQIILSNFTKAAADIGSLEGCFEENLKDFSINNRALRVKNRFPPFVSRIGR